MKLALLGHGQMARVVETQARDAGHDIGAVITSRNAADAVRLLPGHPVAIDFSVPGAVVEHVTAAVTAGVPLVEGTTGWQGDEPEVRRIVEQGGGALIYGANFSIGINLFYRLVAHAAQLFRGVAGYEPFIEEAHHARKRDAPSGTALALQATLSRGLGGRSVPVASTRAGHIPGTHRVGLDSAADQVLLVHTARSRAGFAVGALLAARWIAGRRGMYAFDEVLDDVLALGPGTAGVERKVL
jgi:4-hydroxy-tetrahydrodipicolinate reductase